MATMKSTPPRRPRQPRSTTRTSYHVGRPWMFEGKMLRADTGTPIRSTVRAKRPLAEAEPEPLTFANLMTKSFTPALKEAVLAMASHPSRQRGVACPHPLRLAVAGVRDVEQELLHVP